MPGGWGRHGRGWRGVSRRAVRFVEPTLLLLLQRGPAHGYTLIARLSEFGLADTDPSAIYRALRDMEARGWVVSSWEQAASQGPPRRIYRLTPAGHEVSDGWRRDLVETRRMLDQLLDTYEQYAAGEEDARDDPG